MPLNENLNSEKLDRFLEICMDCFTQQDPSKTKILRRS